MEETSRLATTIDTWWPAVLVALTEDVTNARTEGFNRIIKQTKRVGCGFTNMDNYRRRIMVHIALTRGQRPAAWNQHTPRSNAESHLSLQYTPGPSSARLVPHMPSRSGCGGP